MNDDDRSSSFVDEVEELFDRLEAWTGYAGLSANLYPEALTNDFRMIRETVARIGGLVEKLEADK